MEQKPRAPECVIAPNKYPTKEVQDLSAMTIDELWALHEKVSATLVAKMTAEKKLMEDRLRQLDQARSSENSSVG